MIKLKSSFFALLVIFFGSCGSPEKENSADADSELLQDEANLFIGEYTESFKLLYYELSQAEWESNTRIVPGDTTNAYNTQQANEAYASFVGSEMVIERTREFLEQKDKLTPLQVNQLETILYIAANSPATVESLVKERIKAETAQTEKLFGFDFKLDGRSVTTNDLDDILKTEASVDKRLAAWRESKEVGKVLKEGLNDLRGLRNETVQALGYDDYFTYQVSDYGMTTGEMMDLNQQLIEEIWPLYRELHTYARYNLAKKYKQEVPEMIPAHWLPNRWGQDWSEIVSVEGVNLDAVLAEKGPEWLIKQAERFYISLGFDALPESFYEESSMYPLPEDAEYKKNNHASAWHMDLEEDVRCLMSVIPNAEWYETTHHELGHIYYFISYTNPDVPPLLREGANRAFHEAVGSLMGLAAMQEPFLAHLGLVEAAEADSLRREELKVQALLKEALNYVVFIPFSAGVMTSFEHDLYVDSLGIDEFNERWWTLSEKFQGIVPPTARGEEYCDAASKTHINNDAAQYYDYALSNVILFQLHDYIAKNILDADPRNTNYYGNKEVGAFLKKILTPGATKDWRALLKETTGEELSAKAMLSYFEPLMEYLKKENQGRKHTLPEKPV